MGPYLVLNTRLQEKPVILVIFCNETQPGETWWCLTETTDRTNNLAQLVDGHSFCPTVGQRGTNDVNRGFRVKEVSWVVFGGGS